MNVVDWLRDLGLEQYAPAFHANDIDGEVLSRLTAEDLRELGVSSIGHRRRLLDAIATLDADRPPAAAKIPALMEAPAASRAIEAERRQLTAMFCDLVDSTALATRLDPEDLREIIGAYHGAVAATVARFDGYVAKYMGDGVLAYFGYPHAHEDDAERAVRADLAVIEAVRGLDLPQDLEVRLGVASGLVRRWRPDRRGGRPGARGRRGNTEPRRPATGPGATEQLGRRRCVTRRLVGGLFEVEDLGLLSIAGFGEAQRTRASSAKAARSAGSRRCAQPRRALVGRGRGARPAAATLGSS